MSDDRRLIEDFLPIQAISKEASREKSVRKGRLSKGIVSWPKDERPWEMLLEKGPEAVSDAAILAILLRTGRKGQNAIELARELIDKFGGLVGLLSARQEDIIQVKGIGKAKMAQILAAMEIVKRQIRQPIKKTFWGRRFMPFRGLKLRDQNIVESIEAVESYVFAES